MRTFSLARVAADAELLRLRLRARRAAVRAILALVALGFLAGAAVFCHLALWYWLRHYFEPPQSALILAGIDVVLAVILALLAARSTPSRTELEALGGAPSRCGRDHRLAGLFSHRNAVAPSRHPVRPPPARVAARYRIPSQIPVSTSSRSCSSPRKSPRETMPITRPSCTTGTWRNPPSRISRSASIAV